jgi:hypothetical protein
MKTAQGNGRTEQPFANFHSANRKRLFEIEKGVYTIMKKLLAVILVSGLVFSVAGCKKQEQKPQLPPGHPSIEGGMPPSLPEMPKKERTVVIPKKVKAKWTAIKLAIEDKTAKTSKEYTVAVGSELAVPNTKMTIKVLAFLPDFKMGDKNFTSVSNKPNRPAAQVLIREPGKEEWKGWLFSLQPEIHSFPHEKIGIRLVGGVSK